MVRHRSILAAMLRERHHLLELLQNERNDDVLYRLRDLERRILREEDRGPRAYLDHIFGPASVPESPPKH